MIDKLGTFLGEGFRRLVYEHKDNPSLVIKFLKDLKDNHNKIEFENWQKYKDTEKGKFLAPCFHLSEDGRFLVQQRVEVLDKVPDDVPEWIKVCRDWEIGGNQSKHWGVYMGRTVLIDYGDMEL